MKFEGEQGVIHHFLIDCKVRNRTKHTLVSYERALCMLVRLLSQLYQVSELEQVTVYHLRGCVEHLLTQPVETLRGGRPCKVQWAVSTVRASVMVWKAFFNWCYQEELISVNPVARLKLPKPDKRVKSAFEPEHIERMLAVCDTSTPLGFRNYMMLLLLCDTGIRVEEICSLNVGDVHDSYVKVFGKGRKEREVGLHPEVSKLLWKYIHKYRAVQGSEDAHLFLGRRGILLSPRGLQYVLRRIQRDAGLEAIQVTPHVFRHTFAKLYLMQGGDLFKLSREMGHSDVSVTKIYLEDFSSSEARKEHATFSPITSIHLKKSRKRPKKQE